MVHPPQATRGPKLAPIAAGDSQTSLDARIHPLTLRFSPALDERFADEYFAQTLVQVRLGLVLAIGLYANVGVLDTWIAPAHRHELWLIRYAAMCPIIAACLTFS